MRALLVLLLLAACGQKGPLASAPGQPVPPKPLGVAAAPTPQEMLDMPAQAAPTRVDDPVKNANVREADRFELPPS
jgi:predicted small lipoprotein YifL